MGIEALKNPNSPKVVLDQQECALYFSRSVIPYLRGVDEKEWLTHHTFYKHIGLYAYRRSVLSEITQLPPGRLEQSESLEQLRWLENGYRIRVGKTDIETIGIDTPEDLQLAADFLAQQAQKTIENFVVSGRKAIFAHITTEVFPQVFKILSIYFSMRKFIFITLAAAFFALQPRR